MGKAAKLEYTRRIIPLFLAVLALVGGFYFISALSSLMCLLAAGGIYAALPRPTVPSGAIKPLCKPPVMVLDMIGFVFGLVFFPLAIIGMIGVTGGLAALALLALVPASASFLFFMIAVRQETSWVRFFGNGFEFTQFGLRNRVQYEELDSVDVRLWQAAGWVAWFQSTIGSLGRRSAVLLNGERQTNTLVFKNRDGATFTISSELLPDLQRILIGMDRAGVELPDGISEGQRKKIRQRRERMYGGPEREMPESQEPEGARIQALIEHARRQAGH